MELYTRLENNIENKSFLNIETQELRESLKKIDFNLFKNSTAEVFSKNVKDLDFVLENNIREEELGDNEYALFDPYEGEILFSKSILKSQFSFYSKSVLDIYVLETFIHEQTHAIAKNEIKTKEGGMGISRYLVDESNNIEHAFWFLNEGITEKSAREILVKYLGKDNTYLNDEKKLFCNIWSSNEVYCPREKDVKLVNLFIKRISEEIGLNESDVWTTLKESYMKGEDLFDNGIRIQMSELFDKDFLEKLSKYTPPALLGSSSTYNELIRILEGEKSKKFFQSLWGKIK